MTKGHHPASPWEEHDNCGNPTHRFPGLTKREYFAVMAMQGLCVQAIPGSHNTNTPTNNRYLAIHALNIAEELLDLLAKAGGA